VIVKILIAAKKEHANAVKILVAVKQFKNVLSASNALSLSSFVLNLIKLSP